MSDQFIGEIRLFPYFRGAPSGWLACDGSTQPIASYEALASLLGTTYGGDGSSTFGLPELRGRVPIGVGSGNPLGSTTGTETVTLMTSQLPGHNHFIEASTAAATQTNPSGQVYADGTASGVLPYAVPASPGSVAMAGTMVGSAGQGLPHDNCAPTLPLVACIARNGIWPPNSNS